MIFNNASETNCYKFAGSPSHFNEPGLPRLWNQVLCITLIYENQCMTACWGMLDMLICRKSTVLHNKVTSHVGAC